MKSTKPRALTEQELDHAVNASPLVSLKSRLARNEASLGRKEISTPFAALDAIEAIFMAHLKGHTDEELAKALPEAWGKSSLSVPLPIVAALAFGWSTYRNAPSGRTIGECFEIEAVGGQGKSPKKRTQQTKRKAFGYAYAVLKEYALARTEGVAISLEKATNIISERRGVSFQTVKDALEDHGDDAKDLLREQGWWK